MPHLDPVTVDQAEALGAGALYERIRARTRNPPTPFFQAQGRRPDLAQPLWAWFEALMLGQGMLGRPLKETIATRVSLGNACRYCTAAHSYRAKAAGVPADIVDRLAEPLEAIEGLDPRWRAMLAFADKVRDSSPTVDGADWDRVRAAGWSDEEIVEGLQVVGAFSAFNRMADALGVEFTPPTAAPQAVAGSTATGS